MSRFIAYVREKIAAAKLRELLLWCLPALLLALVLRVALTSALPYAFYHDDTTDFIQTADGVLNKQIFVIHEKKTFLSPIAFSLPIILHIPTMVVIPIIHHLLGMVLVLMVGALCRLWLRHWKWFIIPVTLAAAANPSMLWYEHTLMAEAHFVFTMVLVALAGSLYATSQSRGRFILLCVALFLNAGARPEGKLIFGFGALMLAMLHFRDWRDYWRRLAVFALLAAATFYICRTSQAGLLLYTSVARFTPTDLRCAPGFEPYIAPIRADLQARWEQIPLFHRVRDRKDISREVKRYLDDEATAQGRNKRRSDERFCMELARETCLRNLTKLPEHTFRKFAYHACDTPAARYDQFMVFKKQREAYMERSDLVRRISPGLFGRTFESDAELDRFIDASYREVPWFNTLSDHWYEIAASWRLADRSYPNPDYPAVPEVFRGLPIYMIVGLAGLIFAMLRKGPLVRFHIAWGVTLLVFIFVVILAANVRARFRFFLEPFWPLYIALLADLVIATLMRLRPSR